MALIRCPHCGTENDTRESRAAGADRMAQCKKCGFVFVTQEKVARIIREEGGGVPEPRADEPTDISSGVATPAPPPGEPTSRVLTLTATVGPDSGKVWREQRPLLFIGRFVEYDDLSLRHVRTYEGW